MPKLDGFTPLPLLALLAFLASCGSDSTQPESFVPEVFTTSLSAGTMVGTPPNSAATGTARFTVGAQGGVTYTIDVAGINAVIQAHIHAPATPQQSADIVLTLFEPNNPTGEVNGRLVSGSIPEGSPLLEGGWTLAQVLQQVRAGMAHVLVHTTEYPNGEIRGNLAPE